MFKCSCGHKMEQHARRGCGCSACKEMGKYGICIRCGCIKYNGPENNLEYIEREYERLVGKNG